MEVSSQQAFNVGVFREQFVHLLRRVVCTVGCSQSVNTDIVEIFSYLIGIEFLVINPIHNTCIQELFAQIVADFMLIHEGIRVEHTFYKKRDDKRLGSGATLVTSLNIE